MVELFAAGFFDRTPRLIKPRLHSSPNAGSPRKPGYASQLALIPWTGFIRPTICWTNPPALATTATVQTVCTLQTIWARNFSVAPLHPHDLYGIELTDCSFQLGKGLLVRASLELDEPLSWHPALRVSSDNVLSNADKMVSLVSLRPVGTGFNGLTAPNITMPSHVFRAGLRMSVTYRTGRYK